MRSRPLQDWLGVSHPRPDAVRDAGRRAARATWSQPVSACRPAAPGQSRPRGGRPQGAERCRLPDLGAGLPRAHHPDPARGLSSPAARCRTPRLEHPPLRVFWFTGKAFTERVETHEVDGVPVRIYGAEKTLADCFKYRNRIGLDTAVEALRRYVRGRRTRIDTLMSYARICRVEKVMRPYLEALR